MFVVLDETAEFQICAQVISRFLSGKHRHLLAWSGMNGTFSEEPSWNPKDRGFMDLIYLKDYIHDTQMDEGWTECDEWG